MRTELSLMMAFLLLSSTSVLGEKKADDRVLLIAHRGGVVDKQRIENSLPAIEEAVRRRYHMLEVDIRESG